MSALPGRSLSGPSLPGPALLFCPGDRPDRFAKAATRADGVILDLEDAVAPGDKRGARGAVAACDLDPATTIVRVNPVASEHHEADVDAVRAAGFTTVMLAKAETPGSLEAFTGLRVVALCETPLGVENAGALAAEPTVVALMWGAEDLVAGLGGQSSRTGDGAYREVARYARSRVLIAAAAHGKVALDAVHLDIGDLEGLAVEAADAVASGFVGTPCIHPGQVAVVREAYRPSDAQVGWARRVLGAAEGAPGVFSFEGRMIDEPLLAQARRTVAAAER